MTDKKCSGYINVIFFNINLNKYIMHNSTTFDYLGLQIELYTVEYNIEGKNNKSKNTRHKIVFVNRKFNLVNLIWR